MCPHAISLRHLVQVANGYRPPIPDWVPASVSAAIQACWEGDSHVRPNVSAVVEMLQAIVDSGEGAWWWRRGVGKISRAQNSCLVFGQGNGKSVVHSA